jgi:type IV pilus assembly protein PilV
MNVSFRQQRGVTLLEVLISIVIMSIGLLGLAGLFSLAGKAEVESYQRIQALTYLNDMADRMASNGPVADCYVSSAYGSGTLPSCGAGSNAQSTRAKSDMAEWVGLLQGSTEKSGTTNAGGLIGARGCVEKIATTLTYTDYRISVAWQGMGDVSDPDSTLVCGKNAYGSEGRRRVVSTLFRLPALG